MIAKQLSGFFAGFLVFVFCHLQIWRTSVAHDYSFLDLAGASLVTRVCNLDGALIYSQKQAACFGMVRIDLGPIHRERQIARVEETRRTQVLFCECYSSSSCSAQTSSLPFAVVPYCKQHQTTTGRLSCFRASVAFIFLSFQPFTGSHRLEYMVHPSPESTHCTPCTVLDGLQSNQNLGSEFLEVSETM